MSETQVKEKKILTPEQLKQIEEIDFKINIENVKELWTNLFYKLPFQGYQGAMRGLESVSKKLMVGKGSVVAMPVGIILRNTTRAAHNSSEGRYLYSSRIIGGLAAAGVVVGATLIGGPLLAAALPSIFSGSFGAIAAYGAVGVTAALAAPHPVFTAATLLSSTIVGLATGAVSVFTAAPLNAFVAWRRSKLSAQGYEFSEDDLRKAKEEFDRDSPTLRHERENMQAIERSLGRISEERRKDVYESLKDEFEKVAQNNTQQQTATAAAAPSARRKP